MVCESVLLPLSFVSLMSVVVVGMQFDLSNGTYNGYVVGFIQM